MTVKFDELADWNFEVDEVSAGVYSVTGKNRSGNSVEEKGTDPDRLLAKCKAKALKLEDHKT